MSCKLPTKTSAARPSTAASSTSPALPTHPRSACPSKSSIVNSSIVHVHVSCRHRLLAARKVRALKMEADALTHNHARVPKSEEPVRFEGFRMVICSELEDLSVAGAEEDYGNEVSSMGGYDQAPPFAPLPMYHGHGCSPVIASPTNMNFKTHSSHPCKQDAKCDFAFKWVRSECSTHKSAFIVSQS
ncbi:hypothetical protein EDD18DRAFT_170965 [Armillaria luteobubalina]|uniref:Uncharacterized protein n=1 Tax=Armillaria luteobubalina TaxID=153913 RepID=A0AA39Q5I6_9AGAR|nr:hypothetical protein EDD18DRAFT_170965 [Armillaria luteobubalina]